MNLQFGVGSKNDTEKAVDSFISAVSSFDPLGVATAIVQAHVFPVVIFLVVRETAVTATSTLSRTRSGGMSRCLELNLHIGRPVVLLHWIPPPLPLHPRHTTQLEVPNESCVAQRLRKCLPALLIHSVIPLVVPDCCHLLPIPAIPWRGRREGLPLHCATNHMRLLLQEGVATS